MSTVRHLASFALLGLCLASAGCKPDNPPPGPAPAPAPAPGGIAAPGSASITKQGSVVVITTAPVTLTNFNPVDQYQDGAGKGTPTSSGPQPNSVRDRWLLTYVNGSQQPWEGFRIEVAGPGLDTLQEALRSATIKSGWGAAPGWGFRNDNAIDSQNKGAKFLILGKRTTPPQVIVKPGETVQLQVDMGCFEVVKVTPVGCKYHLSVKPIA